MLRMTEHGPEAWFTAVFRHADWRRQKHANHPIVSL